MKDSLKDIITLKFMPCHQIRERSLVIKGKQFPVCYRCMFILVGLSQVSLFYLLNFFPPFWLGVMICMGMNVPLLMDGLTQRKGLRKSNNFLRSITGYLSGTGLALFIVSTSHTLVHLIIHFVR